MEKLKKELKKQKDKESSLLEEKDKLKQVPRQCPTFILERTLHMRKERVPIDTENKCLLFPTRFLQWSCNCYLRPKPNVELFIRDEPISKLRSSVGSDVELRTRQANQLNQTKKQF